MKNIKYLTNKDLILLNKLISNETEFSSFSELGWNNKSIDDHLKKKNNFSIGFFLENKIFGFLIGEKIINKYNFDLDIHIMYVSKNKRRKKIGSRILEFIEMNKKKTNISKIFLEVSENNQNAINFYEKNNFVFFNFRHNYYNYNNEIIRAKCYSKKL